MPLPIEPAALRRPRGSVVACLPWACGLLSIGLSGCGTLHLWDDPAPVVTAPSAPVVVATPPVLPAVVATPPVPASGAVDSATPGDLVSRRALANHELLRAMSPPELAQEIARLVGQPASPDTSIDLAMALMLTRNGGELNRAIGLVEPLARNSSADGQPWQPLARLLVARLLELRRLEDLLDRRNQELRDSQRDVKQLNEKLEALKAIERSLEPRAPPPTSAAPAAPTSSMSVTIRKPSAASSAGANAPAASPAPAPKRAAP